VKRLGWVAIAAVYLLTLATQLPHIYDVYSALERSEHFVVGFDTALGAAIAFEASVALFTLRTIVNYKSERSRWTRPGIAFFLALSMLANTSYYFDIAIIDNVLMPLALTVAIPVALWLYADEFGAEAKATIRKQRRSAQESAPVVAEPAQPVEDLAPGKATVDDWRTIYRASNGDYRQVDADGVADAVRAAGYVPPSDSTLRNWAREARGES
jgi:hypothetical protein